MSKISESILQGAREALAYAKDESIKVESTQVPVVLIDENPKMNEYTLQK